MHRLEFQVITLFLAISFARTNPIVCREPAQLPPLITDVLNESIAILPGQEGMILRGLNSVEDSFVDITRENISNHRNTETRSCSVKSTCPWHFVKNVDPNRRPKTIIEAQCSFSCCKRSARTCCDLNNAPGCTRCQPIYYYVHVLRRTGCDVTTRRYTYENKLEKITAGCTCIRNPNIFRPPFPTMPS
ncbi:interleukin 17-like protein [Ostrea edulis]|uniref:interleukin 17-like protein n=1 Tax=Ostrea edulis TaxID=37623 RepID=UPI0024AFA53C|nr:interleukin 17-like protein [Ostrea edulis]